MKMKAILTALPLVLSFAMSAAVQARTIENGSARAQAYAGEAGREVAAPSWSDACMTDHGPSQCGEPMWVYGSPGQIARYKSAF
jgi:hypothetical protein